MNIVYVAGSPIPSQAASSVHVMKMCAAFAAAGHRVRLHHRPGRDADGMDPFAEYGVERRFELVPVAWPRIRGVGGAVYAAGVRRRLKESRGVDLVYSRHALSLLASAGGGQPLVFESHAPPANVVQRRAEARLFRSAAFSHLVLISGALRREYRGMYPWLEEARIIIAHDAADPVGAGNGEASGELGGPGSLRVGYAGSLGPGRGIELIVSIAGALPGMAFHVFGGTRDDVRTWQGRRPPDNLRFHGHVAHGGLGPILRRMDVLLAPYETAVYTAGGRDSTTWMSPMKLFEYMAAGRAIVCSDLPVLREVLTPGRDALLVPPGDAGRWSEALRRLSDPELRTRLGRAALETFEREHTWAARACRVLEPITSP